MSTLSPNSKEDNDIRMQGAYFDDRMNARRYYRSFRNNEEQFKLGDFVMLKVTSEGGDELCAGEILHLWSEQNGKYVEIRWCHSRNELKDFIAPPKQLSSKLLSVPRSLLQIIGSSIEELQETRELFLSDMVDDCPLEAINFLIKIVAPHRFAATLKDEHSNNVSPVGLSQQLDDEDEEEEEDDDDDDDMPAHVDRVYFCARHFFANNNKRVIDVNVESDLHWHNSLEFSQHEYVTNAETISIEDGERFPRPSTQHSEDTTDTWFGGRMLTSPFLEGVKGNKPQLKRTRDGDDKAMKRVRKDGDQFALAIDRLQLSAVPKKLPCRETERSKLYSLLSKAIESGTSPVVYLSGMPGTGKTATVRQVASELQSESHSGRLPPFRFIELNGMRFREPEDMYTELWASLSRKRLPPNKACQELEKWTKRKGGGSKKKGGRGDDQLVVLMMDELDYILTPKKDILYNLFDWPTRPSSRLIVVGTANTMDLPSRLGEKIRSRSTHEPINFKSYSRGEVETILKSRLQELTNIFEPSAITIAAAKVSAYSGDIRFALQICSRAADLRRNKVQLHHEKAAVSISGPSKKTQSGSGILPIKQQVCKEDIMQVIKQLNESTLVESLHGLAPCEVFVLVALGAEIRGIGQTSALLENVYRKMRYMHLRMSEEERKQYGGGSGANLKLTLSEVMEIVERLASAQVIKQTSNRGILFNPAHRSMQHRLPHLELCVQETFLSETLGKSHDIAKTYFPALQYFLS